MLHHSNKFYFKAQNNIKSYQSLDPFLKLCLGLGHALLGPKDGDELTILVLLAREDDTGAGAVANGLRT